MKVLIICDSFTAERRLIEKLDKTKSWYDEFDEVESLFIPGVELKDIEDAIQHLIEKSAELRKQL